MADFIQYLNASMLLDVCSHLNLMFLLTDGDFVVQFASPSLETHLDRSLAGRILMDAIPTLAGIDQELHAIVLRQAEPWRIRGIQLVESRQSQYDILLMPRSEEIGLMLVVWQKDIQSTVEQVLRQQRNELTLSFDRLSEQASALRTVNDRLASLDRERRALLNLIVRDIKSSVSVITGYSEWLSAVLTLPADSESERALKTIRDSALSMTDLVKDVIVLDRIEQKLVQIDWQPVSLPEFVRDIVAMWQSVAVTQDIHIEVRSTGDLPEIEADIQLLQEAVQVLVRTMIEMVPAGSHVIIRIFPWDRWLVVRFERSLLKASGKYRSAQKASPGMTSLPDLRLALARLVAEGHGGHLATDDAQSSGGGPAFSLWFLQKVDRGGAKKSAPRTDAAPPRSDWRIAGQGHIRIDMTSEQVWLGKEPVSLTPSEYRLLLYLAERPDQIVSHEQIAQAVWPHGNGDSIDKLRVLVWRLRQKLSRADEGPQSIRTVRGFGYMLVS